MRKNTREAFEAFTAGKARRPADSIWTDGTTIYSYGTALLTRKSDGMLILNATKYSPTTSQHQTGLRYLLLGERYDSITGAPRGYSAESLRGI